MSTLRLVLAVFFAAGCGSTALAADKADNKKLIVGKWEVSKADEGTVPAGATVEFSKDGKMRMTAKKDGKEESREGTFSVEGDSLTLVTKRDDGDRSVKIVIKKLTETELTVEGPDGKSVSFKKK